MWLAAQYTDTISISPYQSRFCFGGVGHFVENLQMAVTELYLPVRLLELSEMNTKCMLLIIICDCYVQNHVEGLCGSGVVSLYVHSLKSRNPKLNLDTANCRR